MLLDAEIAIVWLCILVRVMAVLVTFAKTCNRTATGALSVMTAVDRYSKRVSRWVAARLEEERSA